MNQAKLKYARQRLHYLRDEKISAIEVDDEARLRVEDAIDLLAKGKAKVNWKQVKAKCSSSPYAYRSTMERVIMDQVIGKQNAAIEKRNAKRADAYHKQRARIWDEARKVEDELVLGDEAAALALLEKFAKF